MRVAAEALPSDNPANAPRNVLLRLLIAVAATTLLLVTWRPLLMHAQTAPRVAGIPATVNAATSDKASGQQAAAAMSTHVVKVGESLWLLAERYYGDGRQWPELVRVNSLPTTAGRPLLVGMRLRVPSGAPVAAARARATVETTVPAFAKAPAKAPSSAPAASVEARSLASQTAEKPDAGPEVGRAAKGQDASAVRPQAARSRPSHTLPTRVAGATAGDSAASHDSSVSVFRDVRGRASEPLVAERATRIGLVDIEDLRAARTRSETTTVFLRHIPDAAEVDAQAKAAARTELPVPRRGEYEAAPFTIDASAIRASGRVLRRVGAPPGGMADEPQRMSLADGVEITAPSGTTLAVGDRLMTVRLEAPAVANGSKTGKVAATDRVALPTGILRVQRIEAGKPVLAVVQRQSGSIEQGQAVVVIEGKAAPTETKAALVTDADIETTVQWVDGTESLPTLQSYIMLGAGKVQGVRAGDEFELHRPRIAVNGGESIARVRVVRVGARESAAIVVRQLRTDIAVGVAASRVARVP